MFEGIVGHYTSRYQIAFVSIRDLVQDRDIGLALTIIRDLMFVYITLTAKIVLALLIFFFFFFFFMEL